MITQILDYQIHEKVAETRGTVVYRAGRQWEKSTVIIKQLKTMHPTLSEIAQFKHEYRAIQEHAFNGVLKILDIIDSQDCLCLVLQDIDAVSLKQFIKVMKIDLSMFLDIAVNLSETLGRLHQKDIVHRQITSDRILIDPANGKPLITDFGVMSLITHENDEIYNPEVISDALAYISPEQTGRMNTTVDYRTDLYSLGITFYEMLTGRVPFMSNDPLEIFHAHIARKIPSPEWINPGIPGIISNIIFKLLSKTPEDRYQSAFGLMADLETCRRQLQETNTLELFELGRHDISIQFTIPQNLFGREGELAVLMSEIENIYQGQNRVLLVSGAPGIGKSSLIDEVFKQVAAQKGYFITGRYEKFNQDRPYSAVIQAFMGLIKRILSENEARLQNWKAQLLEALGANGRIITNIIPNLELIIGKQPDIPDLEPEKAKTRFDLVFERFVSVFAKQDHPVILFLDNLQWMDLPSLMLIRGLVTHYRARHLLVIGAYRDNEAPAGHPLMNIITQIHQAGIPVRTIPLGPLNERDIAAMIAVTLKCPHEKIISFAGMLHQKTGGNPFFVKHFLGTLQDEKYIRFDVATGWTCDEEKIIHLQMTDNVVDLMVSKVVRLPENTRDILKTGACIGNRFRLEAISHLLDIPIETVLTDIAPAVREGFVYASEGMYHFFHHRIQEAVHALIPDDGKAACHYRIGKYVLGKTIDRNDVQNKLFYIADQLNSGMALITDDSEKQELILLNRLAGKKAKVAAAYKSSLNYLKSSINLLDETYWEAQYNLALDLYTEAAEVAYLCGDFEYMTKMADTVIKYAGSLLDKVNVYEIRAKSYNAQNRPMDAIREGLEVLELLGCKLPRKPHVLHIFRWLIKVRLALGNRRMDAVEKMEDMTDPGILSIIRILVTVAQASYRALPNLLPVAVLESVYLSLKYGNAPQTAFSFSAYGMILCGKLNRINKGYWFGQLAMQLKERPATRIFKARTWYLTEVMINHWKESLQGTLQPLKNVYQMALENGDIEYAALSAADLCLVYYSTGKPLNDCAGQMEQYGKVIRQFEQKTHLNYLNIYHQTIRNLMEETEDPCFLKGDVYDEATMLPVHVAAGDATAVFALSLQKIILCFIFGRYKDAVEYADTAEKHLDSVMGLIWGPLFYFYASLSRLAVLADLPMGKRRRYLKKIAANQKKMKKWSEHAPMNYLHKYYLVEAERARVRQDVLRAEEYFNLSITLSRKNDFLQEEALAHELAAGFYLKRNMVEVAEAYLIRAYKAYSNWGAVSKVRHLETIYSDFLAGMGKSQLLQSSGKSLDVYTIMKSVQAISGEIELRNLLKRMMEITMENAGAQKGYMIFNGKTGFVVEAEFTTGNGEISLLSSVPLESHTSLSPSIVNYVVRTREMLILDNASQKGEFTHDPYVIRNQCRSIMCSPILKKGNVSAVLYLENNLVDKAFTKDRIEVIQVLTSQAAISFENAILYEAVYQSEEKYRTILESIEDGYFETDLDGNITFLNDAMSYIAGWEKDALTGSNFQAYIDRKNVEKILAAVNKIYQSGESVKGLEFIARRKDDVVVHVDCSISLRKDSEGRSVGFRGILRDITEKKETERLRIERDVAKETAEAKSGFLANMSHEIRTPLNAVIGFTRSVMATELSDSQAGDMDRIKKASNHLLAIVNSILELSKMESGKVELEQVDFQLRDIMEELDAMFSGLIPNGVELEIIMDDAIPPRLKGDPLKLKQILINLVNNALKFTGSGRVTVSAVLEDMPGHDPVKLRFSVKDTGIGISADRLSDLFSPYTQADGSTARKYGGTGLGLTISKGLVGLMGGDIRVESEEGAGTTFCFTINLFRGDDIPDVPEATAGNIKTINLKGMKILVAEDEVINRELAMFILGDTGADVTCVANGREAVDAVNTEPFDAVFMDMQMPVMDGIEATRIIKGNPRYQTLPVIAMTGNVSPEDREKCIDSGMVAVVTKPFDEENLFPVLERFVSSEKGGG